MFNNLFNELTDEQQEFVRGGASFSQLSDILTKKLPGVAVPDILTSPNVEGVIEQATDDLLKSKLSSVL
jgi:hypothetical protein